MHTLIHTNVKKDILKMRLPINIKRNIVYLMDYLFLIPKKRVFLFI